ncbi:cell division protein FtsX [Bacteroidota bacterium]
MIIYYLGESIKLFKRAKLASFITIITTSIAILITSFSLLLLFFSSTIEDKLKNRIELNVFLNDTVNVADTQSLRSQFRNDQSIKSARFISKEDAVVKFISETGEDFRSVLDINPLPASFILTLNPSYVSEENIEQLIEKYSNSGLVDEIVYDYNTTMTILNILSINKTLVFSLSLILIIIALYFVYANNQLLLLAKKEQFNTMKLVGANLRAIKIPIVLHSIFLGIFSAIICMAIFILLVLLLTKIYYNLKFINILYLFNIVIFLLGIIFGLIGSYFSIRGISLKVVKY